MIKCDSRRVVRTNSRTLSEFYLHCFVGKINQTNWIRAVHTHWPTRIGLLTEIGMFFAPNFNQWCRWFDWIHIYFYTFVILNERARISTVKRMQTAPKTIFKFNCDRFHNKFRTPNNIVIVFEFWKKEKKKTINILRPNSKCETLHGIHAVSRNKVYFYFTTCTHVEFERLRRRAKRRTCVTSDDNVFWLKCLRAWAAAAAACGVRTWYFSMVVYPMHKTIKNIFLTITIPAQWNASSFTQTENGISKVADGISFHRIWKRPKCWVSWSSRSLLTNIIIIRKCDTY